MVRRFVLLALLSLAAAPALAQTAASSAPAPAAPVRVRMETGAGSIVLELDAARAPITTANFMHYVDTKRYDGAVFYRSMRVQGTGLIQAGIRDTRRWYPPIKHEPTTQTGLSHVEGVVSMARGGLGSTTTDFFILLGPMPSLDAHPDQAGDNQGFAAFGRVVEGMDVVNRIADSPRSETEGIGVMRGQMLRSGVPIISATRVK